MTFSDHCFFSLRYLVEDEGANVEQLNKEEKAVLHDAAQFSNFAVVQFLLQKGNYKMPLG